MNFKQLEERINYSFKNKKLLEQALTHRSYGKTNNERLEFVGDGILDYVIALNLYHLHPNAAEGGLSKLRAGLVNQDTLAAIAREIDLGANLLLGDGELKNGGRTRPSMLADALEAIFAAISFDGGFEASRLVIERLFAEYLRSENLQDYKSILQEYIQAQHYQLPRYKLISATGPDHDMFFIIECSISELNLSARGEGKGKKEASQRAAHQLLIKLGKVA